MKLFKRRPKERGFVNYTMIGVPAIAILFVGCMTSISAGKQTNPDIYVPYQDLPLIIEPADKAVLMERGQFETLLAAAEANIKGSESLRLGQITRAEYSGEISGEKFILTGQLEVVSLSEDPVSVPLAFAQIGLTRVVLDGEPAPLGYDRQGRLTLVVTAKGSHQLEVSGTTKLQELSSGGIQFSMSVPEAVAGNMKLSAPGDLEIHATVPLSEATYNDQTDRTNVELTLGGQSKLTAVFLGNGRQDDDRAILLGESAETVHLTRSNQTLGCFYTIQVLRRGVRQLQFQLGSEWTVTEVTCPSLVRWSVEQATEQQALQTLTVLLRSGKVGAVALHIKASAERKEQSWQSPRIVLVDAESQRGYLMVSIDDGLGIRGQGLTDARREDVSVAGFVSGLTADAAGWLYFHWGKNWSVDLELETVELRRSFAEQQRVIVTPQQVTLRGDFEVTAIERELFDMTFVLRGLPGQWRIQDVRINDQESGFEYRLEERADHRLLKIELPRPIRPEKTANVGIMLQFVPPDWDWPSDAAERDISVPFIESQADAISGHITISAIGDLDASPNNIPEGLEAVPVGRMASLGMQRQIQYAYSYHSSIQDAIQLHVSRRRPRQSSEVVGLIDVRPREFTGDWRINYTISRASSKRLYLLADKSLGQEFKITSPSVSISSKGIVTAETMPVPIPDELSQRYDIWLLNLDSSRLGQVPIDIHYERPVTGGSFQIPLVRPICDGQINEQLAIQASEELALEISADAAHEVDAIDLPPLPVEAGRILAAYQLDAATTSTGPAAAIAIRTAIHQNYEIPSALVVSAELTTYLDIQLRQRTDARFRIANASQQFLTMRLPEGAQLWSLQVDNRQAKPQRSPGGDYQVALRMQGEPVNIRIVYAYQPGDSNFEMVKLGGVELPGIKMNQLNWIVVPPPDYQISSQRTNMQTGDILRPVPAYMQIYNNFKRYGLPGPFIRFSGGLAMQRDISFAQVSERTAGAGYGGMGGYGGGGPVSGTRPASGFGPRSVQSRPQITTEAEGDRAYFRDAQGQEQIPAPTQQVESQTAQMLTQDGLRVRLTGQGRLTLPVDLVPSPGAGPRARFTGLGTTELIVGLTNQSRRRNSWIVGFLLIITFGLFLAGQKPRFKVALLISIFLIASLIATWWPAVAHFANGVFIGAIAIVLFFFLIFILGGLLNRLGWIVGGRTVNAAVVLLLMFYLGSTAQTASAAQPRETEKNPALPPVIIPYDGEPGDIVQPDKVLIPYARFVQLWNQAHPEDQIEQPRPGTDISLADVRYKATIGDEQLNLILTANVETYGRGWVVLPLPITGLAVTEATLDGKAAQLQAGPKGMVLMLPGDTSGRLQLKAVASPDYLGPRGSVSFSLPPLPAAVMDVILPQNDLELEVDNLESAIIQRNVNGTTQWTFGLGMTRELTMRWLPKLSIGAGDRTLSAVSEHNIYAFHWAVVGVSRITYSFSGGEHDRFTLLTPQGTILTDLEGSNTRDYRRIGEKTVEGEVFGIIEVRLYRPVRKQCELVVRWLGELPDLNKPSRLLLVRAGDVSRESGTVALHSAGGMEVKIAEVTGGRRTNITGGDRLRDAGSSSDRAKPVAKYYWPYRPFALFVQLSRLTVSPKVHLDQLVRIGADRVELLVEATLKAEQGKLFGASFVLPPGYELLSAVGPAVDGFYERSNASGKYVHIEFNRGQTETNVALVLLRREAGLGDFAVPTVMYIDSAGHEVSEQKGRVAVQITAALEAQTVSVENLSGVAPQTLRDWLNAAQMNAVQFAYRYEDPMPSLRLNVRRRPTQVRSEIFAGLVVRTTSAVYTYRLRYNISGSPVDHLSFTLPGEYAPLAAVESPSMRSLTQSDTDNGLSRWTVALVNEVTGLVDVAVNFALPIEASTELLRIPRLEADAPEGCRTIVAVQNMSRHDINVRSRTNLAELALSEQQNLMPGQMMESLQYVFQSFEQSWSLDLSFTPAKTATRIQAVVDLLALTTVIGRDGRCRYEARVELQNRSEQFLRVKVPQGLRLWSARVADQPVKPVQAAASPEDEVLIPLVKTSPGGLPYDVYLYFADEGPKPLIQPLNGISRLKPPGISIVGMPVTRTTWSLILPGGYRYTRPGGNMSAVAGTAEMLSLGIEAKLEQLGRLERSYREMALIKGRKGQIVKQNWESFNRKLATEISQVDSYLETNRDLVSVEDYERLKSKLGGQRQRQDVLMEGNTAFIRKQQEQVGNDMNFYLNVSASNFGISETVRNNALQELPEFVGRNERGQLVRLQQELQVSEEQKKALAVDLQKVPGETAAEHEAKIDSFETAGKKADQLVTSARSGKDSEIAKVLSELSRESATQIDRKQEQIKEQLDEMLDNRLQRHFRAQGEPGVTTGIPQRGLPQEPARETRGRGRAGGREQFQRQIAEDRTDTDVLADIKEMRARRPALPSGAVMDMPAATAAAEGIQPYVARDVYSLPVTLPGGEVRLDFARSAGEAEISVLAVPIQTMRDLYRTLVIIVAFFVTLGIIKLWPQPDTRRPLSAMRVVVYILLLIALTVLFGLLGLFISIFIIVLSESKRGLFASSLVAAE